MPKLAALVLSGGGALGAAHIGAARELALRGYHFDYYAGVSAGAIIAAALAYGYSADECLEKMRSTKLFNLLFDIKGFGFGLLSGDKTYGLFEDLFGAKRIEELPIPLVIGATDFSNGERVLIREGRIADAVRASVSVPLLFKPYRHPELKRWLVDGGLSQNLPLDCACQEYKGPRIVAIDVATSLDESVDFSGSSKAGKERSLKALTVRTLRIMLKNQQNHLPADPRVVRIMPDLADASAIDVNRLEEIVEVGRKAVRESLEARENIP